MIEGNDEKPRSLGGDHVVFCNSFKEIARQRDLKVKLQEQR